MDILASTHEFVITFESTFVFVFEAAFATVVGRGFLTSSISSDGLGAGKD